MDNMTAEQADNPWIEITNLIRDFVNEYEFCGDAYYSPKDTEKLLIEDAIHGLLADEDFIKMLRGALSAPRVPEGWMLFPVGAWEFLQGKAPLNGKWFGTPVEDQPYWWRSVIRSKLAEAPEARSEAEYCPQCRGTGIEFIDSICRICHGTGAAPLRPESEGAAPEVDSVTFWVVYDATTDKKYIKKDPQNGALAMFDYEHEAKRVSATHPGTAYKEIRYLKPGSFLSPDELTRLRERVAELEKAVQCVSDLIAESDGVCGLHKNGEVALWDELLSGGPFEEWLGDFDAARLREGGE